MTSGEFRYGCAFVAVGLLLGLIWGLVTYREELT